MYKSNGSSDDGSLNIAFFSVLVIALFLLFGFSEGETAKEGEERKEFIISSLDKTENKEKDYGFNDNNTLLAVSAPTYHKPQVMGTPKKEERVIRRVWSNITAYAPLDANAREGMCFSGNPALTASGTYPRDGIVATNFLPFGTKIRVPALFGSKVFVVEDRMSPKNNNTVDIFLSSQQEAINFGRRGAYVEIIE